MARHRILPLAVVAALLLPLGGALAAPAHRGCCGESGVCPLRAQAKPRPATGQGAVRPACHGDAEAAAEPAASMVCARACSQHGGPAAPAPLRDDPRGPVLRFHARFLLLPRAALAAAAAPAPLAGFAEPATPPPRRPV
jgi:hypothetical protein